MWCPISCNVDVRGDDTDGVSNTGRNLSHEYDMIDLAEFLDVSLAPAG